MWKRSRWARGRHIFLPSLGTRSSSSQGNFFAFKDQQIKVAFDALVDIQAMARCDYFVHGASAMAEAVHYTNPGLHKRSCMVEYPSVNGSTPLRWLPSETAAACLHPDDGS